MTQRPRLWLAARAFLLGLSILQMPTAAALGQTPAGADMVFSVILVGGSVYDGSGAESFVADVGIVGDRIAAIGNLVGRRAAVRLNVAGLVVAPGLVDIHSHAVRDNAERSGLLRWPLAENYIRQGVTTAIGGPDGGSAYPVGEMLARFELTPSSINFGTFVGHGTVRRLVLGNTARAATALELDRMRLLVDSAMQQGAFGLSTGLKYVPGAFAKTDEVVELAKVVSRYGGIHISHMRDEGLEIMASVEETIRIGEEAGIPTQITHHKVVGKDMWGKSRKTLEAVDRARERGVDVSIDQYPYTASSTGLSVLFPAWALEGTPQDLQHRLRNAATRRRILEGIVFNLEHDRGGGDPANVVVAYCDWDSTLNGKSLAQILRERQRPVSLEEAAVLVVELQERGGFQGIFFAMSEEDVVRIMQHPMTMIASDGGIPEFGLGFPHPRNYGAFARVLGHYVRDESVLPLAEAIRKMSSLPAGRIGLEGRGVLRVGAYADVAVFDAETIIDRATFAQPHQYALGVRHVFVNGQAVLLESELTGARAGRALRRR